MVVEGEIDSYEDVPIECNEFEPVNFIKSMYQHLPEDEASIIECTTPRQRATIQQLYEGYANGEWQPLDFYL